ncbi:BACON domain-containing protein [uncultured Bacteroides sp.]|uniref:BACON domain-containing protein n=1 Tax=uncultured Bacteroides sp. TaxID=162156 RepID=UPI0025D1DF28|nr:BACON domain-containing protein [uncultured Bacteroides sp.]
MRNIFLLLSCLLCLQACNDEKDVDWTPDVLAVSCNETLQEAGDGHWKVTLPTEYKGSVKLEIQTDKAWGVEITYMTNEDDEWIAPSAEGGNGAASLSLAIADNKTAKDRKASVVISTKGGIPVKKTITIVQGNVEELLTVGTIDEADFPDDVFITKNAEGSFDVTLPKEFTEEGERQLNILTYQGTATPSIDITYPDEEVVDWVVFTETLVAPSSEPEVKTLALTIKENTGNIYREALVNFTATAGDITSKKTVKIVQYGVERIVWNEEFCQQESEFIVAADANDKIWIATCENINPADLELNGSNTWLELSQEEGKVYAKVLANVSTNKERRSDVVIKNKKTGAEVRIPFKQCMQGYGIVLSKALWSLAAYSGEGTGSAGNVASYFKLFDDFWPANKAEAGATYQGSKNTHIEVKSGTDSNPVSFTFDLGENPRGYDSFGLMPRLQWTAPAPQTIMIEVSDKLESGWETVVEKVRGNGFKKEDIYYLNPEQSNNSNWYDAHYEGIVHWSKLADERIQKRYVRISMYETFWSGSLCLDEVFVADRSNVE